MQKILKWFCQTLILGEWNGIKINLETITLLFLSNFMLTHKLYFNFNSKRIILCWRVLKERKREEERGMKRERERERERKKETKRVLEVRERI
jgi:hypothetical protein